MQMSHLIAHDHGAILSTDARIEFLVGTGVVNYSDTLTRGSVMRKVILLVSICLLSSSAFSQEFWGHRIDVDIDVRYGEDPAQVADLYTQGHWPAAGSAREPLGEPRPTLIWFHGGGWRGGDKASNFNQTVHYLERGWHVANINYRKGPGTAPQAVDDAMCAYKWVVDEARRSGQSDRFVVSGSSAGGHLALMVGLLNSTGDHSCRAEIAPSAVVNWRGVTDIEALEAFHAEFTPDNNFALLWIGDRGRIAEISSLYSPLSVITDEAPPIISIHGTADDVVPYAQAEAMHSALHTRNRLVTLEGGTHGGFSEAQYQEAMAAIFEFLEE